MRLPASTSVSLLHSPLNLDLNLNLSPYRLQPPTSNISQHASTFFLCLQPQTSTPPTLFPLNLSPNRLQPPTSILQRLPDLPLRASSDIIAPSKLARCPLRDGC